MWYIYFDSNKNLLLFLSILHACCMVELRNSLALSRRHLQCSGSVCYSFSSGLRIISEAHLKYYLLPILIYWNLIFQYQKVLSAWNSDTSEKQAHFLYVNTLPRWLILRFWLSIFNSIIRFSKSFYCKFLLTFARLLSIKSNTHITFHYIVQHIYNYMNMWGV